MEAFLEEFQHLQRFNLKEIKSITGNFNINNVIGVGGFGKVYKGVLSHSTGQTMVACKRLSSNYGQGNPEFLKEIFMLSRYTHENLITLLGFCDEVDEKILVYERASHGSLDRHLSSTTLTWRQRLKICLGAAKGLCYLHDPKETQQRVIHRDIKSSNILLDENWNAKVSDMGLSKIGPANQKHSFLVSNVVGTFGYVDPMYMQTNILTKESDIYSFGLVLFEVLFGRLCFTYNNGNFQSLVEMWKQSYQQKKLDQIIFGYLKQKMDPRSLETFSSIAYNCLHNSRKGRPTMSHVVEKLKMALWFQEMSQQAGCKHSRRRCKLVAPCCNKLYWCPHCHNEYTSGLNDPKERHNMVRKDVKQVVCMNCNMQQQVHQICGNFAVKMGEYFCGICNVFEDDTSKQLFHCNGCGICRVGGRENCYQCDKCVFCFTNDTRAYHICVENSMKRDCFVCHEYLFDSIKVAYLLKCGHSLHVDCHLDMLKKNQTSCLVCSKPFSYVQEEDS